MFFNKKEKVQKSEGKKKKYLIILVGSFVSSCSIHYEFIEARDKREVRGYIQENRRKVADSMDNFSWKIVENPEIEFKEI